MRYVTFGVKLVSGVTHVMRTVCVKEEVDVQLRYDGVRDSFGSDAIISMLTPTNGNVVREMAAST
jgi:hypothetical protein